MKYIKRISAVKQLSQDNSIIDTTNIVDKRKNTYSAKIIDDLMKTIMPIGSGMDYYGSVAPKNYMFADGSAISRTRYAELFNIIGTTYGEGDGSTTFNLPDKRCRVTAMYKEGDNEWGTLGQQKGSSWFSYTPKGTIGGTAITVAQMPSHTHTLYRQQWYSNDLEYSADSGAIHSWKSTTGGTTSKSYKRNGLSDMSNTGSGQTHTHSWTGTASNISTIQPTLVCNYIIKVSNE